MDKRMLKSFPVPSATQEDIKRAEMINPPEGFWEKGIRHLLRADVKGEILILSVLDVSDIKAGKGRVHFQVFVDRKEHAWINRKYEEGKKPVWRTAKFSNVFYISQCMFTLYEEQKLAAEFFNEEDTGAALKALYSFQNEISNALLREKHRKEREEIDSIMSVIGPVPEALTEWILDDYLKPKFFYEPDRNARGAAKKTCVAECTKCNKKGIVARVKGIRHRAVHECPFCGHKDEVICRSRIPSGSSHRYLKVAMLEKISDREYVWRYFATCEHITVKTSEVCLDGLYEAGRDFVRIRDVKKGIVEYERFEHFYTKGESAWWRSPENGTRNRWSTMQRISGLERYADGSCVYPGNLEDVLAGEAFRYFPMKEMVQAKPSLTANYERSLERYLNSPGVERIIRIGLYDIASSQMYWDSDAINKDGKTVLEYLKLKNRNELRMLIRNGGSLETLTFIQEASRHGIELTDQEIELRRQVQRHYIGSNAALNTIHRSGTDTRMFLRYMMKELSLKNLSAKSTYLYFITAYTEYLDDLKYLGISLNRKNRYPSQLIKTVERLGKQVELQRKLNELNRLKKINNSIDKVAKRIEKRLQQELFTGDGFLSVSEKDKYCIMLPHSLTDLSAEGAALSHCVGSWGYENRIIQGESIILFVRKKSNPGSSFYTMEYGLKEKAIRQCRTVGDGSYDVCEPQGFEIKRAIFNLVKERKKEIGTEYLTDSDIRDFAGRGKLEKLISKELAKAMEKGFDSDSEDGKSLRQLHIDHSEYLRQVKLFTKEDFYDCVKAIKKSLAGRKNVFAFSRRIEKSLQSAV